MEGGGARVAIPYMRDREGLRVCCPRYNCTTADSRERDRRRRSAQDLSLRRDSAGRAVRRFVVAYSFRLQGRKISPAATAVRHTGFLLELLFYPED
jgi:hypothetical protein